MSRFLVVVALSTLLFETCPAKPLQVLSDPHSLNPVHQEGVVLVEVDNKRDQRSPQFGFPGAGIGPVVPNPVGCLEFGCGGGVRPGGYFGGEEQASASANAGSVGGLGGLGGSFASANAESSDVNRGPFGAGVEESQANAESANINLGPFGSASFNAAQASSVDEQF